MRNRSFFYLPLVFAVLLSIGIIIGFIINPGQNGLSGNIRETNKINDVLRIIERDYVDTVDQKELMETTLTEMLHQLDPHSAYIPAKQMKNIEEEMSGNFEGIGIQFRLNNDTIYVVMPISGGPSAKKGIRAGDRIVGVNGRMITGHKITNDTVVKLLKGPKGSKVQLTIYRPSINDYLEFEIIRDKIPMYSIDIAFMPKKKIGYVKINRFAATTYDEFVEKTDRLLKKGMKKLIIDLRDNGGGYLSEATSICNDFLTDGTTIVYTEGRNRAKEYIRANSKTRLKNIELIILINELSASASEIVSGAIQDNDRGTIIGRRSFGKGLVQEQLEFPDNSAIRLTVARYYTPTGRCIQKSYKKGYKEYEADLLHRYSNDELINPDSIHFIDSLKYTTPGGKVVYGGGGIMPDIFVPIDTSHLYAYFNALSDRGLIYQTAFDYLDKNRSKLKQEYKNADAFVKKFKVSKKLLNELIERAKDKGVPFNEASYKFCKTDIATRLKAYIGRGLYDDEAFYPVLLQKDKTFQKALEVFKQAG